ncbi:hypothetical protein M5E83_04470 [Bifidobacterium adolescentis]|uniref:hypothetical protein n=1 Tax=Bifidobacterium adolescentis TaxID=1680 RepID=UPI00201B8386|nr:hypothetical protein [Bifidobacterium adolescentis]UQT38162.1 hypothetical protein M5E83_04470 [Bifidobacterium adolescentis]
MASHVELNPDDNVLGLSLGMKAMRLALTQKTHKVGTVRIPTGGDTDVIIGDGAQDGANRIDQDGNQLPLVDTSEIEQGVQQAQKDADDAAAKADEAIKQGEQIRQDVQVGIDDARKQAQDAAAKADKARSDLQAEVDANKKATDAAIAKVDAKADKAQSDLESQTTALKTSIANVDAKADQVKADADKISQRVDADKAALDKSIADVDAKAQAVADAAQKSADKANAATVELDKSIQAVDAKAIAAKQAATEAQSKAENVASDLDSANAVIEQHITELGTLTTKVSNAVTKADSALNVSTEAKQTATEASTTASSAYKDSQTALTQSTSATQTASVAKTTAESASKTATDSLKQSSSAVQTANQVSTILRTEYQTKADADKLYATQSSVTQTSDSIKSDVAKTYATKEALTALQNAADNAIESWRGTGVPTLKNKPAVDWTTDAEKKKHSGDLYYDKATGKAYRFGSDDGKNYSWELNQDSDVTKALADASKAQTSANGAQSAADAAQSTASKAQGDVDQLKVDIPATYATKSSLTQTADSITANVEVVKTTANSAVSAASKAQQTADAVTLNLSKNYQTKAAADAVYSTKADLKATSESISADVYKAQGTADGAVTAASKAQQTADAVTLNLSRNYATKAQADSTYAAKTELKTTADGLQADITRSQQTADGAVTAASKAQATADGINATLSKDYQTSAASDEKYSTKADLKAASDGLSSSLSSVKQTADGAVTTSSKAQQTADGISANLSKNYQTKAQADTTYATKTSLKATSDSLTASINSTAKTAQSAVDKATSLEANLNGFKTTVSQTYTTKDDLDKLSVGGTNLIKGTSGNWSDWIVITPNASNFCKVLAVVDTPDGLAEGADYTTQIDIEFADVASTGGHTALACTQGSVDGSWSDVFNVFADSLLTRQTPVNAVYHLSRTNKARKSNTANRKFQLGIRCDWFASGKFRWRRIKAEKGSKATDWSPAPEDLQPAGDYSTKSELMQTADSIKAQVSEVSKTASGAMSKATTVEQTANGLSTRITAQGKTLDATTKTANEAKSTADSNKQTISQVKTTADGAVSRVSSLEQNLDGFESTVAKTYQPKDGMSAYATTSALKQTSDSITAQVAEVSKTASGAMSKATTVEQTANGLSTKIAEQGKTLNATVTTANEAKSTADSNKTTISQTANLVDAALAGDNLITDGGFESTEWWKGLKTPFRISTGSFYHGKHVLVCDAATGDNRCPLTHEKGMAGTATAIPVTKGRTYRLSGYCAWYSSVPSNVNPSADKLRLAKPDGTYIAEAQCGKSTSWSETHVDWKCPDDGSITSVRIEVMHQANGSILWDDVAFRDITEAAETSNRVSSVQQNLDGFKTTVSNAYQTKAGMSSYATTSHLTQTANQIRGEVSEKYQSKDGMGSYATNSALTQKANEITGKVQEVAKTASGNTTTISQVSQKADKINTTLSQKIDGKADVSRVSSLEQNLSGFKTTVAQSYQPKGDYPTRSDMQSSISQTASSIKSEVANTYTTQTATEALRKSATRMFTLTGAAGKAKWVRLGHLTSNGNSSSVLIHVYSGNGWDGNPDQNAEFEIFVKDGWRSTTSATSATGAFGVSVSRIRNADDVKVKVMAFSSTTCDIWAYMPWAYWNGHYTLQGDYKSWQDGPNCGGTRIQDAEPTEGTAQDLAYDTLSTRSYVDQTAKSVALGVVQSYKGSDGSGLATKSDITATKKDITSSVSSTYATKTGVTQEISSKITQNNNSLDVKFSTKVETQNAQNKANTADSHATNAQSRVGSLEDCINFTASGVRVGKRSNGKFTGVSALVNTNGTFDLLDASGNLLTRINRHRFQVTGDGGTGSGYLSLSQDGINITVQPTADTSKNYHIQVGKSGVGITAPDGSSIECSASGGLNIETVKFGKIAIGSGGLQFANDQGWGLKLSAAGWSIKWAGNHTLATGPKAGALYIDGHEIVTR